MREVLMNSTFPSYSIIIIISSSRPDPLRPCLSRPILPPPTTSTQESDGSSEEIVVAEGGEAGTVSSTTGNARVRRSLVKWWEGWKDVAEEFVVDNKFERFK